MYFMSVQIFIQDYSCWSVCISPCFDMYLSVFECDSASSLTVKHIRKCKFSSIIRENSSNISCRCRIQGITAFIILDNRKCQRSICDFLNCQNSTADILITAIALNLTERFSLCDVVSVVSCEIDSDVVVTVVVSV